MLTCFAEVHSPSKGLELLKSSLIMTLKLGDEIQLPTVTQNLFGSVGKMLME